MFDDVLKCGLRRQLIRIWNRASLRSFRLLSFLHVQVQMPLCIPHIPVSLFLCSHTVVPEVASLCPAAAKPCSK